MALLRQELGRRVASARVAAGLTQQQLAEAIGLKHAQDVSRYERGKVEVPDYRIDRIAEATRRPRSYFTRDPDEPDPEETAAALEAVRQELAEIRDLKRTVDVIEAMLRTLVGRAQGA